MNIIRDIKAVADFAENPGVGTGLALFVAIAEEVLPFLPHDTLQTALTSAARRRADAEADLAEDVKFGP